VRVIAGALRGRTLKAPPGDATRPTGARVREALFSILGDVSEQKVLDLYAGSGALGIEAMSRGASSVVFLESARPALACLRDNLQKLGLSELTTVLGRRVEGSQAELRKYAPFELVLCDPPWRDVDAAVAALCAFCRANLLAPGARVMLEHAAKQPPAAADPSLLRLFDQRRWGDTAVDLFEVVEPAAAPASLSP
jgi:16S rRNA (guanine966-N2)-methyltransferase